MIKSEVLRRTVLTSVTALMAGVTSAVYDKRGNLTAVTDDKGTISHKYDAMNRVTEYTDYKGAL